MAILSWFDSIYHQCGASKGKYPLHAPHFLSVSNKIIVLTENAESPPFQALHGA